MKKKYRNIVVNNIKYAWSVGCCDEESHEQQVNIWKDKKIIHSFWTVEESICPRLIAKTIKEL